MPLHYADVFVAGGLPSHTYNPRSDQRLESNLVEVNNRLNKLVIITGHTKTGKTVLVRHTLPQSRAVWIDGGTIGNDSAVFWDEINLQLGASTAFSNSVSQGGSTAAKGSLKGSWLPGFFPGVEAKTSLEYQRASHKTTEKRQDVSPRVVALRALRENKQPLVIDDFHFLTRDFQREVIRAMKSLIFDGLPVIIIAIPHKQYDAVRVEKEMAGRVHPIKVPEWTPEELEFIPKRGFSLLERSIDDEWVRHVVDHSIGSPYLVQDILRTLCGRFATRDGVLPANLPLTAEVLEDVYANVANSIGRPIYEKLAEGPTSRTGRIDRKLSDGQRVDIYGLVLRAIAHLRPGLITLSYDDIRNAIRQLCDDGESPDKHEITRVLRKMSGIASTEQSSAPVIEFDVDNKLHIIDPFFAFFLRHGNIAV